MQHEMYLNHRHVSTRISAISHGVVRITRTRRDSFLDTASPVVVYTDKAMASIGENDSSLLFACDGVTVRASKSTGSLAFLDEAGNILLQEPDRRPCDLQEIPVVLHSYENAQVEQGQSVDGARAWATPSRTWEDRTGYECIQRFVLEADEAIYGLGSHEEGYGNLRGKSQLLYQHNMKAVVPVLVSTKGWGLLFDMGCMMSFQDEQHGMSLWADCADELDWYFFYGDGSYASLMERYRLLTGAAPMLPRYALGYIQSKERYVDAAEMLAVAAEYRRRDIPMDMIVLDWQSWPQGQWGWKTFDRERFPDPAGFIQGLHDMDVHFMISIWPSMQGEHNADRHEMLENGFMLGNQLIYNAFDPRARELYWKQANENLFAYGVDAWWCDCTEPFESDWNGTVRPAAFLRARKNTDEAKRYLDPAKISLFSLFHAQGIYSGQRGVTGQKRVCNLTRSSYAGQHRYATVTWSGDVSANWETLRRHIPEGMNFCATGEPYWSTDIGAFFPNSNWAPWFYEGDFDAGVDDLGYRELFVRWAQYAVFLPMMRAHGTGTPREIWRFGEKGELFYDAIEKAIRLRYQLIPYYYTLMAQTNAAGIPMLRIPALVFPQDRALRQLDDQMMLGDALLVKPVTRPMHFLPGSVPVTQYNNTENVYLPAGSVWYELHTGQRFEGGQTILTRAPLDVIPMYVRAGSILPWGSVAASTQAQSRLPLEIIVYPGMDGDFTLYNDAGDGYGYEAGESVRISMHWNDTLGLLTLGARQGSFPDMRQDCHLLLHRFGGEATSLVYTGEEITVKL